MPLDIFYLGFKLHLLCNEKGELINFVLTRANVDDRNEDVIDTLTDKVLGKLYADNGYIYIYRSPFSDISGMTEYIL